MPLPEAHQCNRKESNHKSRFEPRIPVGPVTSAIVHQNASGCQSGIIASSLSSPNSSPPWRTTPPSRPSQGRHKKATPRGGFLIVSSRHVTAPADGYGRWWGKFYLASRYFRRGLPPNYRCRCCVSHPSSRWIGVVPQRYGHQDRSTTLAIDPPFPGLIPENCIGTFKASCQQARPMASHAFEFPWESSDMLL